MTLTNPLNKLRLIKAFLNRDTEVVLLDGRRFLLSYECQPWLSRYNGTHELVWFEPAVTTPSENGAAMRTVHDGAWLIMPRGYFDLTVALSPTGEWFERDN